MSLRSGSCCYLFLAQGAGSAAWKPTLAWLPSQKGLLAEWPQRQSEIAGLAGEVDLVAVDVEVSGFNGEAFDAIEGRSA